MTKFKRLGETKEKVKQEVIWAYSDCNGSRADRNLNFKASEYVSGEQLTEIMLAAIPDGYNEFVAQSTTEALRRLFGNDAQYKIAREGSVCIYVKAKTSQALHPHLVSQLIADELSLEGEEFRIWWD